jgi:hypothetical protein
MTKYTDTPNHNLIMPHLERGPSEYSFSTPKNESATPSSYDMMPSYASLAEIKLTSTNVLQNQEHEKGITREPQKYDEQMMATEYIDNEAKIDNTSACTITSPPFAISPDLKTSPISGSQHVTKHNLKTVISRLLITNLFHIRHLIQFQHLFLMLCHVEKCHLGTIVHYLFLLWKRTTNRLPKVA